MTHATANPVERREMLEWTAGWLPQFEIVNEQHGYLLLRIALAWFVTIGPEVPDDKSSEELVDSLRKGTDTPPLESTHLESLGDWVVAHQTPADKAAPKAPSGRRRYYRSEEERMNDLPLYDE